MIATEPQRAGLAGRWARSPRWQRIGVLVLAAVVLFGMGTSAGRTRTVTKTVTRDVVPASTQNRLAQADAQLSAAHDRIGQLEGQAAAVAQQKAQLDQQAQALAAQKAQLDQRQAATNASTFGDGLYQVGKDIQAGQYHTTGTVGSNCYWAKLRSSNTSDIADNNLSPGPQTVVIDSPYFTSRGCAAWTKVG